MGHVVRGILMGGRAFGILVAGAIVLGIVAAGVGSLVVLLGWYVAS